MRVSHSCSHIQIIRHIDQLKLALKEHPEAIILGGGSNVLIVADLDKTILVLDHKGIQVIDQDDKTVIVNVAAGELWDDLIQWCLNHKYGGIENLSLIPGKCGAAPVQNIGAYGVELSDVLVSVGMIDRETLTYNILSAAECHLGYRDSVFKNDLKNRVVITDINLCLHKDGYHRLNLSYGVIASKLEALNILSPSIGDISRLICDIRKTKLPDPDILPNVGSFFKNPIVPVAFYDELKKTYKNIPHYAVDDSMIKIPAAWLIDQCGLKGWRIKNVGTHITQPLVIVNYGAVDGQEILDFSKEIQQRVKELYNIDLHPEVNIIS